MAKNFRKCEIWVRSAPDLSNNCSVFTRITKPSSEDIRSLIMLIATRSWLNFDNELDPNSNTMPLT